ncbi:MAG: hypothetical protein ACK4K9_04130 [Bacteroidia bacterium]
MEKELSEIEWEILNAIYFVEPFEHIVQEVNAPVPVIADCLKQLIHKRFVVALEWNEEKQDYIKTFMYDTDNMCSYRYLATKEGLLAHNSR